MAHMAAQVPSWLASPETRHPKTHPSALDLTAGPGLWCFWP